MKPTPPGPESDINENVTRADLRKVLEANRFKREVELIKYLKAAPKPEWLEVQKIWGEHTGLEDHFVGADLIIEGLISFAQKCELVPSLREMHSEMHRHLTWGGLFKGEDIGDYTQMWISYICSIFIHADVDKIKGWS